MLNKNIKFIVFLFTLVCSLICRASFATVLAPEELRQILNNLEIASDCNAPKYSRKLWKHWIRQKDGYNTRQIVLFKESLIAPALRLDGKKIVKGRWYGANTAALKSINNDLAEEEQIENDKKIQQSGCLKTKTISANIYRTG